MGSATRRRNVVGEGAGGVKTQRRERPGAIGRDSRQGSLSPGRDSIWTKGFHLLGFVRRSRSTSPRQGPSGRTRRAQERCAPRTTRSRLGRPWARRGRPHGGSARRSAPPHPRPTSEILYTSCRRAKQPSTGPPLVARRTKAPARFATTTCVPASALGRPSSP
ncbi:hypothetical protein M885DRAFT_191241 [Pelagophyceae sp. CCMP2097]|nr:hypothetical protein M885DRAFT_191241 [Pelagophyceae sp. CCMP2097]